MPQMKLKREQKLGVQESDIIIAIMGPTGAGKSNFIEKLNGGHPIEGAAGKISSAFLKSYTSEMAVYRVYNHPLFHNNIVMVDTPGFDDTKKTDLQILEMIGNWLQETYGKLGVLLSGVLYFHRITDNRFSGTANKNLRMFGKLCGDGAATKVTFVTTMWDKMSGDRAALARSRVDELKSTYWKNLVALGARSEPFNNSCESAWGIIDPIAQSEEERKIIHLQNELVNSAKRIQETDAGKALYEALNSLLTQQRETLDQLVKQMNGVGRGGMPDPARAVQLQEKRKKIEDDIQTTMMQMQTLKLNFMSKLVLFFKRSSTRGVALGD
ncbi:hypothetical protein CVT24_012695 [Panaeolus cyanescens]|uniref:Uncharacterized protein n=1 Tax=Panaeolus cyanescens TaxID=181874 RepID=A0A409YK73_9AGAR|nr:hypothetical protein CVT24_012695 [Panaeolus cyanescens]